MPGVRASFRVDARDFSRALMKYAAEVQNGKTRTDIVREQMAFAIRAIIDLTPFETLAQGREAVHADLLRAMKPYGGENGSFDKIKNVGIRERLQRYLRTSQYDKIQDVFTKLSRSGFYSGWKMVDFDQEIHRTRQDIRGHVVSDYKTLVPQVREWRDYLRHLQGQVGRARGGWVPSAEAVGLNSLPQWVTRWRAGGAVNALIEPGKVTFTFINRAVFMPRYRDKVETALAGREKAMANDLRRMYRGAASHAGFGR